MSQIIVKNLYKSFEVEEINDKTIIEYISKIGFNKKNITVLENINLSVKKGECLGIVGRNGSGKSTLLKLLAKTYTPSSGEVIVNGKIMPLLNLGFGFEMNLSGRENVFLFGSLLGLSKKEINSKMKQLIEYFEFPEFIDRKFKSYSDGMKLRLAFATVMVTNPDIVIIDEGIVVGDYSFQLRSLTKIKQLKKEGKTIVIASHDFSLIKSLCDYTLCLEDGKIVKQGSTIAVIDYYKTKLFEEDKKRLSKHIKFVNEAILNLKNTKNKEKIKEKEIELTQYVGELAELISLRIIELKTSKEDLSENDKKINELTKEYKELISKYII